MRFQIRPQHGVGPILLGMSRTEVHAHFGSPERTLPDGREQFLRGFFVDYDDDGKVEFIELARVSEFEAVFEGVCLHDAPAEDALRLVQQKDEYDPHDPEAGYSFIFPRLQLSLWRGVLPDARHPKRDSSGHRFEAVGIGKPGYFAASQATATTKRGGVRDR